MKNLRNNFFAVCMAFSSIMLNTNPYVLAASGDIISYRGKTSALRTTDVFRLSAEGNLSVYGQFFSSSTLNFVGDQIITSPSDIYLGVKGTVFSTATTSGNSMGTIVTVYLTGSNNAVEGSLLIATTPVAGQGASVIVSPATADQTGWVGISTGAFTASGACAMYIDGFVLARTTQTVNAGDVLVSTAGAVGYLAVDNTPTTGADVGVAMGIGNSAGGLTLIRLNR